MAECHRGGRHPRRRADPLVGCAQDVEELRAVALEFLLADAGELRHLGEGGGAEERHLAERRVVEDDVGGDAGGSRELEAQSPESVEESRGFAGRGGSVGLRPSGGELNFLWTQLKQNTFFSIQEKSDFVIIPE